MRYLCTECGHTKPAPPYRSNLVVNYLCHRCRSLGIVPQAKPPIGFVDKVILIPKPKKEVFSAYFQTKRAQGGSK